MSHDLSLTDRTVTLRQALDEAVAAYRAGRHETVEAICRLSPLPNCWPRQTEK
jgi:hypothetical protein